MDQKSNIEIRFLYNKKFRSDYYYIYEGYMFNHIQLTYPGDRGRAGNFINAYKMGTMRTSKRNITETSDKLKRVVYRQCSSMENIPNIAPLTLLRMVIGHMQGNPDAHEGDEKIDGYLDRLCKVGWVTFREESTMKDDIASMFD